MLSRYDKIEKVYGDENPWMKQIELVRRTMFICSSTCRKAEYFEKRDYNMKTYIILFMLLSSFNFSVAQRCTKIKITLLDSITHNPIYFGSINSRSFAGQTNEKGVYIIENDSFAKYRINSDSIIFVNAIHPKYLIKRNIELHLDGNCCFVIYLEPDYNWKKAFKEVQIRE